MQTFVPNKSFFDANFKVEQKHLEMGNNVPRLKPFVIKENSNFTTDTKDDENPFGLTDAQVNSIVSELNNDHPVAVGMRWFGLGKFATETVFNVELLKNVPVSDLTAGHSVAFVGYRKHKNYPGGGYFIFRNSWGEDLATKVTVT